MAGGLAIALFLASGSGAEAGFPAKPNLVLIFIDDMGQGDIGPFGNQQVRTPHLDRLAAEGMKFPSFYATPVCSMSRACLMTGCYNVRVSVPGVLFPDSDVGLHPDETTLAEVVKPAGYATCAIGKWHLGHHPEFLPTAQGFDRYFGIPYSNDMGIGNPNAKGNKRPPLPLLRGTQPIETEPDQAQLTKRYTAEAVAFLKEQRRDRPFFLYLPHTMVHFPLAASADFKGKSAMGLIGDAIEEIDWSVGRIMATLQELGFDDNTLVVFTSDNGPAGRTSPHLRGSKASTWEGGVREPCIMRWPGIVPAGTTCDRIAGNIDLLPTFAKLAGTPLPAGRVLDGKDLSPLLRDPNAAAGRDTHLYFARDGKLDAIRQGDWKLFLDAANGNPGKKANAAKQQKQRGEAFALYDLAKDVKEQRSVAAEHPAVVARLKERAATMLAEIQANQRPPGRHAKP